jgi:poly(3-hydroxyoctanoate) depolymerase
MIGSARRDAARGVPDWDVSFVQAGGLRLRVGRYGAGRPLLLITGIGAHLEMWAPFARHAAGLELIGFDPPGAGMSQRPRLPMRMSGLAAVVERLMDESGLDRVDVLGYSWGGGVAQELARRAPDRVGRLVLCATGPGLGGTPPRPLAALMLATPARYYHPRLLALSVPYIAGGRYPAARSDPLRRLASRIPDARLHVVKDGGHLFLLDEPENVGPAIVDFLCSD